ncbi:MAG: hypothetical protein M5U32_13995 [Myxococcota bacterium]|nr:hypothetical protein [Myxococcota bacterium]
MIQKIVDQFQQAQRILLHHRQIPALCLPDLPKLSRQHRIQRRQHQRQRRPQLMMNVCREPRFRLVQLPELVAGGFELYTLHKIPKPEPIECCAARHALNRRRRREARIDEVLGPSELLTGNSWHRQQQNQKRSDNCAGEARGKRKKDWHAQEQKHQSRCISAANPTGDRNHGD